MSWLSDAFHGIENVAQDVGNWAAANESWLLPVGLGVGALATGGAIAAFAPELFGAEALGAGAAEAGGGAVLGGEAAGAGAEAAGAFGEGAAGIEAGIGGTAADVLGAEGVAPAVDITVSPFVEGAAGAAEGADVLGGAAAADLGGVGTDVLAGGGPFDTLLGGVGAADITGGATADLAAADVGSTVAGAPVGSTAEEAALASLAPPEVDPGVVAFADTAEEGGAPAGDASFAERFTGDAASMARGDTSLGEALRTPSAFAPTTDTGGLPSEITTGTSSLGATTGDVGASSIATPGAGGGAGIGDALGKAGSALGGAFNNPLVKYGLPLGIIGAEFLRGPGQLPPQTKAATDLANTQATFGATEIAQAQAGTIDPAYQAQIDQNTLSAKNQLYQLYASRGIDPRSSTDFMQASAQIDQQATAARAAVIQQMITNGLNFENAATSTLNNAAQQQVQLDTNFNTAITSAMSSFGVMAALSGGGRGSTNVNITAPAGTTATTS